MGMADLFGNSKPEENQGELFPTDGLGTPSLGGPAAGNQHGATASEDRDTETGQLFEPVQDALI